jgi:hypothetical protein
VIEKGTFGVSSSSAVGIGTGRSDANLDNPLREFVPPNDMHSEHDKLINVEVAADERNQVLTVARHCTKWRNLEQNRAQSEAKFLRAGAGKMNERGGNAGVSD